MSKFAAAGLFIASVMMFMANFSFAAASLGTARQYDVMEALSQMVRFPGEPLIISCHPNPSLTPRKGK